MNSLKRCCHCNEQKPLEEFHKNKSKSDKLQAHHIKPVKDNKHLILDVDNGLTVCEKCHKEIHYGKNRKNYFKS